MLFLYLCKKYLNCRNIISYTLIQCICSKHLTVMFWHREKKTPSPQCTADLGLSIINSGSCLGKNNPYLWILIRTLHLVLSFCSTALRRPRPSLARSRRGADEGQPQRRAGTAGRRWLLAPCRKGRTAAAPAPGPCPAPLPQPPGLSLSPQALRQQGYTLGSAVLDGAPSPESWERLSLAETPARPRCPRRSEGGCWAPSWAEASIPNKAKETKL